MFPALFRRLSESSAEFEGDDDDEERGVVVRRRKRRDFRVAGWGVLLLASWNGWMLGHGR